MTVWSNISEFATGVTDSVGQALGAFSRTSTAPEKSVAFTIGMIALGAKMAKADGVVTDEEVQAFRQVFHVPEKDMGAVERVFNLAKQDVAGFESYATQVARLFTRRSTVLEHVVDGLFHIAKADGVIHPDELAFLQRVAEIFGFSASDFLRIQSHHMVVKDDPYLVLGLPRDATPEEIRKHYKALVRKLHPDRQIAKGVPAEMVKVATEKMARITAAYAEVQKERAL